ncbi:MAG: 50S ribosomal protein L13 [Candidatus Saccharibacteria bacterium]|nr:50S ribosomal protein L13 [Candidatus Saccharibacteria bacterium]
MTKIVKAHKTFSQKPTEVNREWHLLDASEMTIGRLAEIAARLLVGKDKVSFTPHVDGGDYVVVINAKDIKATGDKEIAKNYFHHTGFPGGIKSANLKTMREKFPERIVEIAVKGMLPKNKLQDARLQRLKVYADANHMHEAQAPKKVEVK